MRLYEDVGSGNQTPNGRLKAERRSSPPDSCTAVLSSSTRRTSPAPSRIDSAGAPGSSTSLRKNPALALPRPLAFRYPVEIVTCMPAAPAGIEDRHSKDVVSSEITTTRECRATCISSSQWQPRERARSRMRGPHWKSVGLLSELHGLADREVSGNNVLQAFERLSGRPLDRRHRHRGRARRPAHRGSTASASRTVLVVPLSIQP